MVADEDQPDAGIPQRRDRGEQDALLGRGQRRRRLVHDDDPRLAGQRAGDLHQLLLRDAEPANQRAWRNGEADAGEQPARLAVQRGAAYPAEPAARQMAEEDVLGHRTLGDEAEFLVDHDDPGIQRVFGTPWAEWHALKMQLARIGAKHPGENLHQGGLPGAILADDTEHLPPVEGDADIGESFHPGEPHGDALHLQQPRHAVRPAFARGLTAKSCCHPRLPTTSLGRRGCSAFAEHDEWVGLSGRLTGSRDRLASRVSSWHARACHPRLALVEQISPGRPILTASNNILSPYWLTSSPHRP